MLKQWKRKDRDMVRSACMDHLAVSDLVERIEVITREADAKRNTWQVILKAGAGAALVLLFLGFSSINRLLAVPPPSVSPTSTPSHSRGAFNTAESYRTGYFDYQYSASSGDTLEMIAYQAGVNAGQIKYGFDDRAAPDFITDGTQLKIPSSGRLRQSLFAPPAAAASGLPLLTKDSTPDEIQARMDRVDTWSTMKAKYYYLMETGVPGYAGPVGQMMELVLLAKGPELYTVIASAGGRTGGSDIFILSRADGINFNLDPQGKTLSGSFESDQILTYLTGEAWYYPQEIDPLIEVMGEGQAAGRPAVIIEKQVEENIRIRFWIDAETGFTLRWQLASGLNNYLQSFIINSIEYNIEIAPQWLDPGRPWWDLSMEDVNASLNLQPLGDEPPDWLEYLHLEPNPQDPPVGFRVRSAPLTLQWPGAWNEYLKPVEAQSESSSSSDELYPVEIYASDYLLGTVPLDIVRMQSCLRSPDGQLLALMGMKQNPMDIIYESYQATMYLLRLNQLPQIEDVGYATDVGQYAFSPNSTKLLWAGCSSKNGCGFHLYDFSKAAWEKIRLKDSSDYISALGWSSDSQTVGYVVQKSSFYESSTCMVFSIDTRTGSENLEKTDIDCALGKLELKSLGYVVGKDPVIDGCIYP
jgi:hypothetical protein